MPTATHLVVHAGCAMADAVLPARGASSQLRQAVAVVLDEEDHEEAMEELEQRRHASEVQARKQHAQRAQNQNCSRACARRRQSTIGALLRVT